MYILSKNQNKNMLQNHRYSFAIVQISRKRGQIFHSLGGVRGYSVQRHFQQYFSHIVAVSLIGGGNQSTRRKLPTHRKSLTNLAHNVASSTPRHQRDSGLTTLVVICTDYIGGWKYTTMRPRRHDQTFCCNNLRYTFHIDIYCLNAFSRQLAKI